MSNKQYEKVSLQLSSIAEYPTEQEAAKDAKKAFEDGRQCAFIFRFGDNFAATYFEAWGQCTYPLPKWKDDRSVLVVNDSQQEIGMILPNGTFFDLRTKAPFLPIIPCPICETTDPNNHAFARCSVLSDKPFEVLLRGD
jgi:hypothetical protein